MFAEDLTNVFLDSLNLPILCIYTYIDNILQFCDKFQKSHTHLSEKIHCVSLQMKHVSRPFVEFN